MFPDPFLETENAIPAAEAPYPHDLAARCASQQTNIVRGRVSPSRMS
jgi:hypothetical protein